MICISPQKNLIPSHANCMQHVRRCWQKQSDGSAPDPAEGAYSAPANPLVGGEGLAVPSPRTPSSPRTPALGPSGLTSPTPTPKLVLTPMATTRWSLVDGWSVGYGSERRQRQRASFLADRCVRRRLGYGVICRLLSSTRFGQHIATTISHRLAYCIRGALKFG